MAGRKTYNAIDNKEQLLLIEIGKGKYGGYKLDLLADSLNEIEIESYICTKCNGIMRNACLVGDEQNLMCETCILEGEGNTITMLKYRAKIANIRVKCPLERRGCVWKGNIGEIDVHSDECMEYVVHCSNLCGVNLKRYELMNHCENECLNRIVNCIHCKIAIAYKDIENHYELCLEFSLVCPNECLRNLIRKELESHIEKECPNTLVACPYKEMGCEVICRRYQIHEHEKAFESKHLDITVLYYTDRVEKMENQVQNKGKKIERLTVKETNLEIQLQNKVKDNE